MTDISRRVAIGSLAAGAAGVTAASAAPGAAQTMASATPVPAFRGQHQPKPLRFDPAKLDGLSERLIRSHWENNYQGSVRALNMIEGRLATAIADKDFPPVAYGGLKREELHRTGSVVLHELYFDALGGDGQAAGGVRQALAASYGSFDAWEAEFRRTAMSLAGGSGWCILAWNHHSASLHNYWCWDHTNGPATGTPLVVLDMYEHAFHMDYGAAAAKYVDAFLRNLDWEVVERRYALAIA
ncbi:MAG: Fe-Mn family superoxide dismutase [Alphaproteobacteria bacterium]|nr:Fe-Mn family superoxide dismutase [Alphaproteobacteria bacterium]MBU0877621.1 Fe-Mn family superoxide dismutase [Alphaproteobacteria bacterium]MBU1770133.1 Fe-Mn family superoxide dismutase [Alphaproteobacteria bacterium]